MTDDERIAKLSAALAKAVEWMEEAKEAWYVGYHWPEYVFTDRFAAVIVEADEALGRERVVAIPMPPAPETPKEPHPIGVDTAGTIVMSNDTRLP